MYSVTLLGRTKQSGKQAHDPARLTNNLLLGDSRIGGQTSAGGEHIKVRLIQGAEEEAEWVYNTIGNCVRLGQTARLNIISYGQTPSNSRKSTSRP